ncbi:MAG: DUF4080 domain-containing protein [Desulfocapsaceae bacterium]|nr:DUF4080 domain-containing protein [Desulfocapsaceae bacterium]
MMKIVLVGLNARYTHSCLALFYIRNEILNYADDLQTHIAQFTINDPYYQMLLHLSDTSADYYFISTAIWNSDLSEKLATDLLSISPKSRIVVGGPQAEIVGMAVDDERCTMVIGEIEGVGTEFYEHLQRKELQRKYIGAKVRSRFSSPYIGRDFATHLEDKHIYYESSRGCPFSCTYCLSASQTGVFHKDLQLVEQELRHILRHNPKVLRFVDRTFNDNPRRSLAIWEFLLGQQCDTVFHFEISPVSFSEEMFAFLERLPIGKFQFEIGIQSTNEATLKAIRRPMDIALAHETIERLRQLETIHLHVDLILGLPYETAESFYQSFRDVFAMNPHYIQMGLLKILPDTPICHTAPEFKYTYSKAAPYSVLANKWLDHPTLQDLFWFSECVERFLNNRYFVSLWAYLREKSEDIVEFFWDLLEICRQRGLFFKAPTQKFLISLLLDVLSGRSDKDYIFEILRYDWLRCGHRFLPPELEKKEDLKTSDLRKKIFHSLQFIEHNDQQRKNDIHLLKKGVVVEFSHAFLEKQGYQVKKERHFLCFTTEVEQTLYRFNRVVHFSLPFERWKT